MNNRLLRISELLFREVGQDIQREFEFPDVLVSLHSVEVAPDLKSAQVFVGVIGSPEAARKVVARLNSEHGPIQNRVARRVVLRCTPVLRFQLDDSVERGVGIIDLLDSIEIPDDIEVASENATDPTDRDD